jgi:uncharacterized protein YndB with AHSA1/START domain
MKVFEYITFIGAPSSRVWEALVTPEQASRYYLLPMLTICLEMGGDIVYGGDGDAVISGRIQELIPGSTLSHTFSLAHRPEDPESLVLYELEDLGEMTRLCLSHGNFPSENATYADISGGWPIILSNLKTYLETGGDLPWPDNINPS